MTRLATCDGGTRLVRCGNRVQLCGGTFDARCASIVNAYGCPDELPSDPAPPGLLYTDTEAVQVYAWTYERVYTVTDVAGVQDTQADYLVRGLFGTAWQWNRPATDPEIRGTFGVPAGWSGSTFPWRYTVLGGSLWSHAFQYQVTERNDAGPVDPVGWQRLAMFPTPQSGVTSFGWLVHLLNGNSGTGNGVIQCQDQTLPQITTVQRVTASGDPNQPTTRISEWTEREELPAIGGTVIREDRRTLRLEPAVLFVRHLDTWEGPPGFNVCEVLDAPEGVSADPNAAAIASSVEADPLRRGGCCG